MHCDLVIETEDISSSTKEMIVANITDRDLLLIVDCILIDMEVLVLWRRTQLSYGGYILRLERCSFLVFLVFC